MRQLKITKSITNRETASLDKYLQEIGREELITADEEVILAKKIKLGDQIALEKLTKANLRFVVSVSKQYQNQGLSLPDIINEGNLGLIKAAQRFDETRGFKFISYAVWWIRQAILAALAENARIVRIPLNQISSINKLNRAFSKLEQKLEREPSPEELAVEMETEKDWVEDVRKLTGRHISLDAEIPTSNDETTNMYEHIHNKSPSTDFYLENESFEIELERVLKTISSREADVIKYFFGLKGHPEITLGEIGEKLGVTRERARQIKEKAVRKMKHNSRSKRLRAFLDRE